MGNGFALAGAAGGGAQMLQEIMKRRFMEQIQQQRLAEEARQADMQNKNAEGRLALGGRQLDQDAEQFGVTSGQGQQRIDLDTAEQPVKLRFMGAQSDNLERQPQREADARTHDLTMAQVGHGYDVNKVRIAGEEQRRTEGTRGAEDRKTASLRIAGAAPKTDANTYADERTTRVLQSVDELDKKVSGWTAGMGSTLSAIPATDARNFAAELNTLKANIAFGELAEMRAASKTGGALGSVSEKEMALLESATGALDQGQSPANLKGQLAKIKASLQRWDAAKRGTTDAGGGSVRMRAPNGQEKDVPAGEVEHYKKLGATVVGGK